MTERAKIYRKELSKRVIVNVTIEDYARWKAAAELEGRPLATMIRRLVEFHISDIELSEEHDILELIEYQQKLKED